MSAAATPGLLERERELRELEAAVAGALDGRGRSLLLEGPAGIGKTELLRAAVAIARRRGARTVVARGSEFERAFAFGVVRQLFEPLMAETPERDRAALLTGAASLAGEVLGPGDGPEATGRDTTFATLHGLYWLCVNLADRRPLVLAVDDLQWADAASLRWIAFLARRIEGLRVLLVATLRTDGTGAADRPADELVVHRLAETVRPPALSAGAVGLLVERALAGAPHADFVGACHEATRGNPLFVRELLDTLRQDGVAPTAQAAPLVQEVGPRAVGRLVLARLAALGADAERLAHAAALVGDGADPELARGVAELEAEPFEQAAHGLAGAHLVGFAPRVAFVHPVTRAAILAAIAPPQRAQLARRAVALLTARGDAEAAAGHLLAVPPSGDPAVVDALRRASRRALTRGAPETAVALLRRALAEPPDTADEPALLHALGLAELRMHATEAPTHLRAAFERTPAGAARAERADDLAHALHSLNRSREALEVAEQALAEPGGEAAHPRLLARTVELARFIGDHDAVVRSIARAEATITDARTLARVRGIGAYDAMVAGAPAGQVATQARQALADGALADDTSSGSMPLFLGCMALAAAGDVAGATAHLERGIETARRRGSMVSYTGILSVRARLRLMAGDLPGAEADCREVEELGDEGLGRDYGSGWLLESLVGQGKLDETEAVLRERGLAGDVPALIVFNPVLYARGRLRAAQGRMEQALADLLLCGERQDALGAWNPGDLPWRGAAAEALAALGRRAEADAMSAAHLEAAQRFGAPAVVARAERVRGAVLGGAEGLALAERAVARLEGTDARLERAEALLVVGRGRHAAGDVVGARELLREARALAEACGAAPLVEAATAAALAAGARPRRARTSGSAALTPAERRTAEQAAAGLSNRQIAQASFVTEKTVEGHLSSVYRKLGIASRAQLAAALERAQD